MRMQVRVKRKRDSEDVYKRDVTVVDQRYGRLGALLYRAVDIVVKLQMMCRRFVLPSCSMLLGWWYLVGVELTMFTAVVHMPMQWPKCGADAMG